MTLGTDMTEEPNEESTAEETAEETEEMKVEVPSITIALVLGSKPHYKVVSNTMNPYVLPTLLRQLAKNYEEAVLKTGSLIE